MTSWLTFALSIAGTCRKFCYLVISGFAHYKGQKCGALMFSLWLQYIPRNMHTVFALLCFVVVIHWLIFPYPRGLLHWHCGNLTIAQVPAKQPWWIWINTSCEFITNDCITTTKQSTIKPCAYFLGYTVGGTNSQVAGHPRRHGGHVMCVSVMTSLCCLFEYIKVSFSGNIKFLSRSPVITHWSQT